MNRLDSKIINKPVRPERVLQFGEGVFLRAFADDMIDRLNEHGYFGGSIVVVPPTPRGSAEALNAQDGLYTVLLRGVENGAVKTERRVVTSISRAINAYTDFDEYIACAQNPDLQIVISNTTEAGIAYDAGAKPGDRPQLGFPAKVAAFLYERFKHFGGDMRRGLAFIPCELIDGNGAALRACVTRHAREWDYGGAFFEWMDGACVFADTLVDRIVSGYPAAEAEALRNELGYDDALLVAGEPFHFWAICARAAESNGAKGNGGDGGGKGDGGDGGIGGGGGVSNPAINLPELLPFDKIGLNVIYTDDIGPYARRKVRLLNGAHTALASYAGFEGYESVGEAIKNPKFYTYIRALLFDEAIKTLTPGLKEAELAKFAESVLERFANPYINHKLSAIMLNATSKFKVRLLPSLLEYHKRTGALPEAISFSFAALIAYYRGRDVKDDARALDFFREAWAECGEEPDIAALRVLAGRVCAKRDLWETDLNALPGFAQKIADYMQTIQTACNQ